MKFNFHQIPDTPLSLLGINRKQLQQLPSSISTSLLNGMRSSILRFTHVSLSGDTLRRVLDGRISLKQKPDHSIAVVVHPVERIIRQPSLQNAGLSTHHSDVLGTSPANGGESPLRKENSMDQPTLTGSLQKSNQLAQEKVSDTEQRGKNKDLQADSPTPSKHPSDAGSTDSQNHLIMGKIAMGHSRVQDTDIFIDIALLASGLGTIILLEHLADLALHSQLQHKTTLLKEVSFRDALADAAEKISQSGTPKDAKGLTSALQTSLAAAGFGEYLHSTKISIPREQPSFAHTQPDAGFRNRSPGR